MNMVTFDLSKFDVSMIQIKKPYYIGSKRAIFEFNVDRNPFICQSPIGIVPFKPNIYEDGFATLTSIYSESSQQFLEILKEIEHSTVTRIRNKSKYTKLLEGSSFNSCLFDNRVKYTTSDVSKLKVYDYHKNILTSGLNGLHKDSRISILFEIVGVQVKNDKYGLLLRMIQIQISDYLISEDNTSSIILPPSIVDEGIYKKMLKMGIPKAAVEQKMRMDGLASEMIGIFFDNLSSTPQNSSPCEPIKHEMKKIVSEDLEVYSRMLKMGVPRAAVEQKMRIDNIDISRINEIIDIPCKSPSLPHGPPPPPPLPPPPPPPLLPLPPPPVPKFVKGPNIDKGALLADIKSGNFKLKSVANIPKSVSLIPDIKTKIIGKLSNVQKPPSLAEILAARKNLRSIGNEKG